MSKPYINKSGRKRGVIYALIRTFAKKHRKFMERDLVPPLTHSNAVSSLRNLVKSGELLRINKVLIKRDGTWDIQWVYTKTKGLRPAELTNRQL